MQGWQQQLAGVLAVSGWLAVLSIAAIQLRRCWDAEASPKRREWSRKLVHIGTGLVVPMAWAMGIARDIAIPAATLVTLLAALNHRFRVLPAVEDVGRPSYGTVAYGASITLLLWIWWPERPATVAAGVLVMAVGDGLAGLLGPVWISPSWTVFGQRRSLLGTAVMASASTVVLVLLASLAAGPAWPGLVGIAIAATLLEQVGVAGVDNLTVPLGVAWLWQALA
ncbi:diacylglycerol/polyprenol kinase family protein [Cyanobium sp. NIES-981]|uniref:diacylglycerol/polyprenol kinase family protein n=1 Tax=Cyanobium sp. NIES-981 TaxID=1851505 RepID=UPI000B34C84E|nr:dolichol kinase [Cyanobium sp. NIES-981]